MVPRKKPPRPWDIDDLLDIGNRSDVTYLKAVPVLILEKWLQGRREEGVANYIRTNSLARRLVDCNLAAPFKPRGTSNIVGALGKIQKGRNLTRPPLIESQGSGISWVNLPRYEPLLQKYCQAYREDHPQDYSKLFPEGEPEWEHPGLPRTRVESKEAEPTPAAEPETQDQIHGLLQQVEQALREREQAIAELREEKRRLRAEFDALQAPQHRIGDEELRNDCAQFLKREDTCADAVRRASVILEERLRKTIGGSGPERLKHGVQLVDYAFSPDSGKLVLSEHPGEQAGYQTLFRGALAVVRNPPMHRKVRYTEQEARRAVGLIDYLLSLLLQARPREE